MGVVQPTDPRDVDMIVPRMRRSGAGASRLHEPESDRLPVEEHTAGTGRPDREAPVRPSEVDHRPGIGLHRLPDVRVRTGDRHHAGQARFEPGHAGREAVLLDRGPLPDVDDAGQGQDDEEKTTYVLIMPSMIDDRPTSLRPTAPTATPK
jgi:hypothetical protein